MLADLIENIMSRLNPPIATFPWARAGWDVVIMLSFFIQMLAWSSLLVHNLARAEKLWQVVPDQKQRNLTVLSADFLEYRDYYRDFPQRISEVSPQTFYVEFEKRPLYGPVSATLTILLRSFLGVTYPVSMYVILSLYASLATMLLFHILKTVGVPALEGGLLAAAGTLSFAWLSVFSIPESYSLSVCAALLAILSGTRLPDLEAQGAGRAIARHALVVGVTSWVYPPICGAVFLVISRVSHRKQWLTLVLPALLLAATVAFAPHLFSGRSAIQEQLDYGSKWSSVAHFADWELMTQVGAAFLFLGIVAPVADFVFAKAEVDLPAIVGMWTTLAGIALLLISYGALVFYSLSSRNLRRVSGALLWFFALFLFHVFYNPREVLLYLSIPVALLLYIVGLMLVPWYEKHGSQSFTGRQSILCVLSVFIILLLAVNIPAVTGMWRK